MLAYWQCNHGSENENQVHHDAKCLHFVYDAMECCGEESMAKNCTQENSLEGLLVRVRVAVGKNIHK